MKGDVIFGKGPGMVSRLAEQVGEVAVQLIIRRRLKFFRLRRDERLGIGQ